jgi:hypothetical protein
MGRGDSYGCIQSDTTCARLDSYQSLLNTIIFTSIFPCHIHWMPNFLQPIANILKFFLLQIPLVVAQKLHQLVGISPYGLVDQLPTLVHLFKIKWLHVFPLFFSSSLYFLGQFLARILCFKWYKFYISHTVVFL